MEELDILTIERRVIHGVLAFVSRTFFIQLVALVVNFLLTILLSPSTFGVFFIVSAAISFLSYFSDIGLAAALIQKKDHVTEEDLKTTFTIQQILVSVLVIIALLVSENVGNFYNLDREGVRLFQALVIAFFLSSLKTIPSIILERNLQFQKLVIPTIVETLFFNITVLTLAIQGFEISSFTFAVLARGVSGVIAIYIIAPWNIRIGISKQSARSLLSFGIPFQVNSFLALIKDDLLTVYLGKVLPLSQVGYIGFAQKWAFMPLRLIMDNVIRITFPSFSRIQQDSNLLAKAVEKSLFAVTFFIFPAIFCLIILFPYTTEFIPKYNKWEPALFSLSFFALNAALSSISTPLTNALNAIGKIRTTLKLMIFWTVGTWILTPVAISMYGYNGVAVVSALIACSVVLVVYIVRHDIHFDIIRAVRFPFFASIITGGFVYLLSKAVVNDLTSLFFVLISGFVFYIGIIFLLAKKELFADVRLVIENLRR